jgi:hypothetical protein
VEKRSKRYGIVLRDRGRPGRRRTAAGRRARRSLLALVALATAGAAGLAGTAGGSTGKGCSSSATKCFGLSISPHTAAPGSSTTFAFTVTNDASTQQLGSLEVTRPAAFTITAASASKGIVSDTATHVLVTTLTLPPGGATSFTVRATAPCAAESYHWGIQVKQSNDFNGTGNTFSLAKKTATALKGSVTSATGGCFVAFLPTNEPKSTVRTAPILSGFDSTGAPVEAGVYTPSGTLAATFSGTVTVTLYPTGAKLSGGSSVNAVASGGVATFPSLSVDLAGSDYRLEATGTGLKGSPTNGLSPVSSPFSIYTALAPCSTADCSVAGSTTTNKKTRITVTETTTTAPAGGFVGVGFGGTPIFESGCTGTYLVTAADTAATDVFLSNGTPTAQSRTATWKIVYEITRTIVKSSSQTGASQWQACYASTTPFTTSAGVTAVSQTFSTTATGTSVAYFVGLLPTCSTKVAAPCILTRHKDNAGDEILTIQAAGDSFVRP